MENQQNHNTQTQHTGNYRRLLLMGVLSFLAMYALMYAMVDSWKNVFPNTNQFYMAGLMAMPMIISEVLIMKSMYKKTRLNITVIAISVTMMALFYTGIRKQTAINDRQFLKSMIPHHAGAILMCDEANLDDPEIRKLCEEIVANQKKEIAEMKSKLEEINN